jgi:hypothetical protein
MDKITEPSAAHGAVRRYRTRPGLSTDDLHGCFTTSVYGTWYVIRAAARVMTAAGYGRIITLGSVLGMVGAPKRGAYAAERGIPLSGPRSVPARPRQPILRRYPPSPDTSQPEWRCAGTGQETVPQRRPSPAMTRTVEAAW